MRLYKIAPEKATFLWGEMDIVGLGERGRGRRYTIVRFHARFDKDADDYDIGQTRSEKPKIIRSLQAPTGWLARVNTHYAYTRGTGGHSAVTIGEAEKVAEGYGAFGIAGRIGSWDDTLYKITVFPTVIEVHPSGGRHKVPPYYLIFCPNRVDRVREDEWDSYCDIHGIGEDTLPQSPPSEEERVSPRTRTFVNSLPNSIC